MLFSRIVAIVAAGLAATPARADLSESGVELRQLSDSNFKASVAKGLWLVEHFSPKCGHCRQFAPTWERLVKKNQHLERIAGFHMAQVNCLAQGDLCGSNNIRGYPQLNLYADGKFIKEFKDARDFELLTKFINDNTEAYSQGRLGKSAEDLEDEELRAINIKPPPNLEGKVVEVDEAGLAKLKEEGPVFVDFFAPWCTHCKALRPTYEKLAATMQGRINIAAVNCDQHSGLCQKEKVRSYPTIKLLQGGKEELYEQYRTLDKMSNFLKDRIEHREVVKITKKDFDSVLAVNDDFFLYLTGWDTSVEEMDQVESALKESHSIIPVYTSSDPAFYSNFSIANPPPTSVMLSFSSHDPKYIASFPLPNDRKKLDTFIFENKQPTIVNLTNENYDLIMKSDDHPIVVLGAVRPGVQGAGDRAIMLKTARAWKRGGRPFDRPVRFVIADSEQWQKWLARMVGIPASTIPAVSVIDTSKLEFYDITLEGHRAELKGNDIFSVLEGVYQQFLKPRKIESGLEWGTRSATLSLVAAGRWTVDHPFLATVFVVVFVFLVILGLAKCSARDKNHGGGYLNEKGGQRLD